MRTVSRHRDRSIAPSRWCLVFCQWASQSIAAHLQPASIGGGCSFVFSFPPLLSVPSSPPPLPPSCFLLPLLLLLLFLFSSFPSVVFIRGCRRMLSSWLRLGGLMPERGWRWVLSGCGSQTMCLPHPHPDSWQRWEPSSLTRAFADDPVPELDIHGMKKEMACNRVGKCRRCALM